MAVKTNCEINGIKYCRKTKTIGKKTDGSPNKKQFYGRSEKDVDEQIEQYMNMINRGAPANFDKITVQELMNNWLFEILLPSKNVKSASFEKHEGNYRLYIKNSEIGSFAVCNISFQNIQNFYNMLYKNGIASTKIFDINRTFRKFFSWCKQSHYIFENPCSLNLIQIPGDADGEEDEVEGDFINVFTDVEIFQMIEKLKYIDGHNNTFNISTYLAFLTGLRKGELLGLKRKFVDLDNCKIKVRNTLKSVKVFDSPTISHRELRLIKPKTSSSVRDVDFAQAFSDIMKKYFSEQERKWKENGLEFNEESLIFTTDSCLPIEFSNHRRAWERFLKRSNIPKQKFHNIRDTYATTLIRKGASLVTVRDLLGHSTIKTTEKYYLFVFPADKKNTANLLNSLIS